MLTRILTGIVGAAVAVAIISSGGRIFAAAILLLSMIGWMEYRKMACEKGVNIYFFSSGLGVFFLTGTAAIGYAVELEELYIMAFMTMFIALFSIFGSLEGLYRHCNLGEKNWLLDTAVSVWSMIYTGFLFAHVIMLRSFDMGPHIDLGFRVFEYGELCLWIVLLGTWASDTFAYFFGSAFGKTPFCSVSPKKSFEGAVAGFVGSFLTVMILCIVTLGVPLWQAVVIAVGVAFFAPLGDLVESIIKRSFDAKDSGKIFPGHGGVLDRFDSLLFTAAVTYYLLLITHTIGRW